MPSEKNEYDQTVGPSLATWQAPPAPPPRQLDGRRVLLAPLCSTTHAEDLYAANSRDSGTQAWTYLPYGPFPSLPDYAAFLSQSAASDSEVFYAIVDKSTGKAVGVAAYLSVVPTSGSVEVGHLKFSAPLQRRPQATEAMYLMMRQAFELGYRRYEWKCDALNAPSRAAAERLGFQFEGVFRQHRVVKGRNRDTAWFSVLHSEWPALQLAFESWLAPDNFDSKGQQRRSLQSYRLAPIEA